MCCKIIAKIVMQTENRTGANPECRNEVPLEILAQMKSICILSFLLRGIFDQSLVSLLHPIGLCKRSLVKKDYGVNSRKSYGILQECDSDGDTTWHMYSIEV